MRSLILAGFAVAGLAMFGASSSSASPAGGTVMTPLSTASPVQTARCRIYCRHRWSSRRHCWRRCW